MSQACPQLGYGEFSRRVHLSVLKDRIPIDGTLELTYRCNLACSMCYCNLPAADSEARRRELTTDQIKRILDEITEAGCLWLLLTGGEITLRPDFLEIYRHAVGNGLIVTLYSNGVSLTERIADALAELPPFKVEVTLYGATAETYEKVTERPGSFPLCLRGIRLLRERRIPLSLKATVISDNAHELEAMRQIASDLGLEFRFTGELNGRVDDLDPLELPLAKRPTPAETVALDLADPQRRRQLEELFSGPLLSLSNPHEGLWPCNAGVSGFIINPYGRLQLCPQIEVLGYDLTRVSFREAWRRFAAMRGMRPKSPRPCNTCELNVVCGSCPGAAYSETGDLEGKIEYMHEVTRLRAEAFGLIVRENELGGLIIHGRKEKSLSAS